jgi:hypothetical protein
MSNRVSSIIGRLALLAYTIVGATICFSLARLVAPVSRSRWARLDTFAHPHPMLPNVKQKRRQVARCLAVTTFLVVPAAHSRVKILSDPGELLLQRYLGIDLSIARC